MNDQLHSKLKGLVNWSKEANRFKDAYDKRKGSIHDDLFKSKFHHSKRSFDDLSTNISLLKDLVSRKQLPLFNYRLSNYAYLKNMVRDSSLAFSQSRANNVLMWVNARANEVTKSKERIKDNLFKQDNLLGSMNESNYKELLDVQRHLHEMEWEDAVKLNQHSEYFVGHIRDFLNFMDDNYFKTLNKISNSNQFFYDHRELFTNAAVIGLAAEYLGELNSVNVDDIRAMNNHLVEKLEKVRL